MIFKRYERIPESPYARRVWMVPHAPVATYPAAADGVWDMIFVIDHTSKEVILSGPSSHATFVSDLGGKSGFGIEFAPGVYLPHLPARNTVDSILHIPVSPDDTFELASRRWQFPTYDSLEAFIALMATTNTIKQEAALSPKPPAMSTRTRQRRIASATGLAPIRHRQIERAQQAVKLIQSGKPITEVAQLLGYSDQAHLTRHLKEFTGYTPGQIAPPKP